MTALLNPRLWISLAVAAALTFAGLFLYRAGKASVRADWNAQKVVDAAAQRQAEIARQESTDKEARDGQAKLAKLEADLAGTRAAGDRLRAAIRAAVATPGTSAAGKGELGSDPVGLFAKLLERADAREERVSGYADRLRIAGETCERYADGLQPANRPAAP